MKQLYFLTLFALMGVNTNAQISHEGVPFSSLNSLKSAKIISNIGMVVNRDSLLNKSRDYKDVNLKVSIFGKAIPINRDFIDKATVSKVEGGKLYQLSISCPNASSLGLSFSKWKLPDGGKLFLWNEDKSSYIGAFTKENNKPWNGMIIRPVKGEKISIEYFEPDGTKTELKIENLIYSLEGDIYGENDDSFGKSASCQVDVNSFEGQGWQQEKRSVVKVVTEQEKFELGGGWYTMYSAALINNTNNDATPYLLTAEHCVNQDEFAQKSIFFFNYESITPGQDGTKEQTIVGAQVMGTKPDLDFCLIKLSVPVPAAYKPYFSGWERSTENFDYAVSIHHPKGDVKKISKSYKQVSAYYSYGDLLGYKDNVHWDVKEWYIGVNEGGSSGSPLFNQNHRIVGDLTGGISECGNPFGDDYQMLSVSWADSEAYGQQLAHWLDPQKSNVMGIDGYDPFPSNKVYMYPDRELCYLNEPVTFTNHSVGNYLNYRWNFGTAAIPQTATGKGPHNVFYSQLGTFTASLTVTNQATGLDETFTLQDYIQVFYREAILDFNVENTTVWVHNTVVFENYSKGTDNEYRWDFGSDAIPASIITYNNEPIRVVYSDVGKKTVTLRVSNPLGEKNLVKPMYLTVKEKVKADFSFENKIYYEGDTVKIFNRSVSECLWPGWRINESIDLEIKYRVNPKSSDKWYPGFKITDSGTYVLKLSFNELAGGDSTFCEKSVTFYKSLPVDFNYDQESTTFSVIGSDLSNYTFTWDIEDGPQLSGRSCSYNFPRTGDYFVILSVIDKDGNTITKKQKTVRVETVTGTTDLSEDISVKVYPNPFTDYVKVDLPFEFDDAEINLIDITGKTVYRGKVGQPILTGNLRIGIYFLKVENDEKSLVKKLIKQH